MALVIAVDPGAGAAPGAAVSVAVGIDGRPVVVGIDGASGALVARRFLRDGRPDPSFGIDGLVAERADPDSVFEVQVVAIQRDGRVLVAGAYSKRPNTVVRRDDGFFVLRLLADGSRRSAAMASACVR